MENKRLYIYTYVDGVNDTTFPQKSNLVNASNSNFFTKNEKEIITQDGDLFFANFKVEQVYIDEYTYTAQRMGNVTLSATIMYNRCLDSLWTGKEYVTFQGEKYFIRQTPTSSKDNTDERYKHELSFVSERSILDSVYFYDVVTDNTDTDRYASNSTNVVFYGDIIEFVTRLNYSLDYSDLDYHITIDEGITSKELQMSLNDVFISNALQEIYNKYELAYYFVGKEIHVGFTPNTITTPFSYGANSNLISITKTNANQKVINRITGIGSSDNIPYYYPNPSDDRDTIISNGGTWITPSETLMPSIYRTSNGANRFYNALNNTYTNPETSEYYVFENPYVSGNPLEHKITFEDIKPTIKGMTNADGDLLGSIAAIAFDTDDNDDMDDEGKYIHPYFFIKLHKFDGTNGFNLFEHSIDENEMSISMTSGTCGACEFVIGVDEETQKNLVQVDSNGNLLRDADGNVRYKGETPQDRQNDTVNYECWIALKKEYSTFGVIMPNHTNNYKPSVGDTFVILHIDLPQAYITAAEKRLDEQIIDYMANNNSEKFNFSINFSRIFLANNPTIANQINENARLIVEYDGKQYTLYISTYTYKVNSNEALPEITVELSDTITVNKSTLLNAIDSIKADIMNSVGSIDFYKQGLKHFIRKDVDEYTSNTITFGEIQKFVKGLITKDFSTGALGSGFCLKKDVNGDSYFEVDRALFRKSATFVQLIIQELKHAGGQIILSPASMQCSKKEVTTDGYKCYFKNEEGSKTIENQFVVNDLARCQTFNLGDTSNRYYWRKVISVGDDYIELSKTIADTGSAEPQVGDEIVQLGNTNDATRQGAIILSSYGNDSPSITLYDDIGSDSTNPFSMTNKDYLSFGVSDTNNKAYMKVYGNSYIGDRDESTGNYVSYKDGVMYINGVLTVGTSIKESDGAVVSLNTAIENAATNYQTDLASFAQTMASDIESLQDQIDNKLTAWFGSVDPTLTNYPANEWTTDDLKQEHLNDTYTNTATGNSWRWLNPSSTYGWVAIVDSMATQALADAANAQDTADKKRQVFIAQPTTEDSYDVGDLWVNATYGTTYSNDLLRCKTAKEEGDIFNIAHWELASKYTDNTRANQAYSLAQDAADSASSANEDISELADTMNGSFKDGVLSDNEKAVIKDALNTIGSSKAGLESSCNTIKNNTNLDADSKTNLESFYDDYSTAYTNLTSYINSLIASTTNITDAQKTEYNRLYSLYNSSLSSLVAQMNVCVNSIENAISTKANSAFTSASSAMNTAQNAVSLANTAQSTIDNLQIGGANIANDTETSKSITTTGTTNQVLGDYEVELSDLKNGDIVNVSFDLNFSISNVGESVLFQAQAWGDAAGWDYPMFFQDVTDKVIGAYNTGKSTVHISYVSSVTTNMLQNNIAYFQLRIDNMVGSFTMKNLMIEVGNKETAWKPSLTDAKNDLQAVQNDADNALSQIGGLDYIKEALNEQTSIGKGLILTSSIQLGSKDSDGNWTVKSGINGIVQDNMPAIWAGGTITDNKCMIGFNGDGKLANGNISWDEDGVASFKNKSTATNDNRSLSIQGNTLQLTDKNGNISSQIDGDIVSDISELIGSGTSTVSVSFNQTKTVETSASVTSSGDAYDASQITSSISILSYNDCLVTEPNNYKILIPSFNISCSANASCTNIHSTNGYYSYSKAVAHIRVTMTDGSTINSKSVSCSALGIDTENGSKTNTLTTDPIQFYTSKKYKIELVYSLWSVANRNEEVSGGASSSSSISLSNTNDTTVYVNQISNLTRIFGNGMIVKQATNKYVCIANLGENTPLINAKDTDSTNSIYGLELVEQYMADNGSEWYRKWNNGWLECGGKCTQTTTGGSGIYADFTFGYKNGFLNKDVCINIAPYRNTFDTSDGKYFSTYVVNANTSGRGTSFTAHVLSANSSQYINGFYYYACGRWK